MCIFKVLSICFWSLWYQYLYIAQIWLEKISKLRTLLDSSSFPLWFTNTHYLESLLQYWHSFCVTPHYNSAKELLDSFWKVSIACGGTWLSNRIKKPQRQQFKDTRLTATWRESKTHFVWVNHGTLFWLLSIELITYFVAQRNMVRKNNKSSRTIMKWVHYLKSRA